MTKIIDIAGEAWTFTGDEKNLTSETPQNQDEFVLSDKITGAWGWFKDDPVIAAEDVKIFIKKLKEALWMPEKDKNIGIRSAFEKKIDKLSGDVLIELKGGKKTNGKSN